MNTPSTLTYLALHTVMAIGWGNLLFIGQDPDTPAYISNFALFTGGAIAAIHFKAVLATLGKPPKTE